MLKFSYEIMRHDPIYNETDWAACPKSREEALSKLRELRQKDELCTYWIAAFCKDRCVCNELLRTEGRYTLPDYHDSRWMDISDDELPF